MFTDLCDLHNIIDNVDFESIKAFKQTFLKNIQYPALFGKTSLRNETLVKAELQQVSNKFTSKIEELNKYLETYPIK